MRRALFGLESGGWPPFLISDGIDPSTGWQRGTEHRTPVLIPYSGSQPTVIVGSGLRLTGTFSPLPRPGEPHKMGTLAEPPEMGRHSTEDETQNRNSGEDWSFADVEDLRDFAKIMTIYDLATVMGRSRHEIQKKLIELGVRPAQPCSEANG